MSTEFPFKSIATDWWSEPLWPYDMDDSYLLLDLGESIDEESPDLRVFKRPWFKQNYRHTSPRNLRFYRRPLFQIEASE